MKPFLLKMPGSKSLTARVLLLKSITGNKTKLTNTLESDDTIYMRRNLKLLEKKGKKTLFCGNAGTTLRFLTGYAATKPFETILTGDKRMQKRPIGDLLQTLRKLGAKAESLKGNGCPPVKIQGPLIGGSVTIPGNVSSQFISGLLMVAPLAEKKIILKITGKILSKSYIEMTIRCMENFGVKIKRQGNRIFIISPQQYRALKKYEIEGDASSATYFWGLAALTGTTVGISNIPKNSIQGDIRFLEILKKMGCRVQFQKKGIFITGPKKLKALGLINLQDMPDASLTVACLCAFTNGISILRGLSNLRIKESDRINAMATELRKIGCNIKELKDGWKIYGDPGKLHGASIQTYNDHRIAMCFSMQQSKIPNLKIENPNCVKKSYPNFLEDMASAIKYINHISQNIVLIGLRGTGKTSLGMRLAEYLKRKFFDIDELIEKRAKKTISAIVKEDGWPYFRILESKIVHEIAHKKNAIIACGGGTIADRHNSKILKKNGKIILLKVPFSILKKRLLKDTKRPPLLEDKNILEEIEHIWNIRKKYYYKAADKIVSCSSQNFSVNFNRLKTALQSDS